MHSIVKWHAVLSVAKIFREQMNFTHFLNSFPKEEHSIIVDILTDANMIENTWVRGTWSDSGKYVRNWTNIEYI